MSALQPGVQYEGTEPWRPPETLHIHSATERDFSEAFDAAAEKTPPPPPDYTPPPQEAGSSGGATGGSSSHQIPYNPVAPSDNNDGRSPLQHRASSGGSGSIHASPSLNGSDDLRRMSTCSTGGGGGGGQSDGMWLCDRTDVFAFGLVLWEMLSGDVPHAAMLAQGDEAYRRALGTRPPLPRLPIEYERLIRIYRCCTQRQPDRRPSAAELISWLQPGSTIEPPADVE